MEQGASTSDSISDFLTAVSDPFARTTLYLLVFDKQTYSTGELVTTLEQTVDTDFTHDELESIVHHQVLPNLSKHDYISTTQNSISIKLPKFHHSELLKTIKSKDEIYTP